MNMNRPGCYKWFLLALVLVSWFPVFAAIDAYDFPNAQLEVRYQQLIDELRCPQCLNTNLAGSDAMIAQDLRREVHEQLLQGKTDEEILSFMRERYGDFILYRPRLMSSTFILWLGPLLLLFAGIFVVYRVVARSGTNPGQEATISSLEEARLNELFDQSDDRKE